MVVNRDCIAILYIKSATHLQMYAVHKQANYQLNVVIRCTIKQRYGAQTGKLVLVFIDFIIIKLVESYYHVYVWRWVIFTRVI